MERLDVLKNLIAFNKPVNLLADCLSKFDWDYEGRPLIVTAQQIQKVLKRFLAGEFSPQELEEWANLIEGREDLEFEGDKQDKITNVIHSLANPYLKGKITSDSCAELITTLGH